MRLAPDPVIDPRDVARGKGALVRDAAWASLAASLYGGVVLVGFALSLGASPFMVGVLAAIPLFAQFAQVPAVALVEHFRQRRKIVLASVTLSRVVILGLALIPYMSDPVQALGALLAAQLAITVLASIAGCSFNSWVHQLLVAEPMGQLFARRLFWSTALTALGALAAGQLIDHWSWNDALHPYSALFLLAAIAGFFSSAALMRVPEPTMDQIERRESILHLLRLPFQHRNFRRVIGFMAAWNAASNLSAPFLAVYLMSQLGYSFGTVTSLSVVSQLANAATLYFWGRLSDRLSNKAILAAALPVYFLCLLALPFSAMPERHPMTLPILYGLHVVMGGAAGGIGLATGNIGLKLAPQGRGTAYLAAISLAGSLAGGLASILCGALADWFSSRELALLLHWVSPNGVHDVTMVLLQHWGFLFAISAVLGLYVLHRLSRIEEGVEVSERIVIQEFVLEAVRTLDHVSSLGGLRLATIVPFGRMIALRRRRRGRREAAGAR